MNATATPVSYAPRTPGIKGTTVSVVLSDRRLSRVRDRAQEKHTSISKTISDMIDAAEVAPDLSPASRAMIESLALDRGVSADAMCAELVHEALRARCQTTATAQNA